MLSLYLLTWLNSFNYSGRTGREDFCLFAVTHLMLYLALGQIPVIGSTYFLLSIPTLMALIIRRLHDINRSGRWLLLPTIPTLMMMYPTANLSGILFLLVFIGYTGIILLLCLESDPQTNQYGISHIHNMQEF